MRWLKTQLTFSTRGKGLYLITAAIEEQVSQWHVDEGMCFLFIQHTTASLVLNENYDPSAKRDLEVFMEKLVPESLDWYDHRLEGPDDSPSHMRTMLTMPSVSIPIDDGKLSLGTWQGIYLFEHRNAPHRRTVLVRCLAVEERR